MYQDSTAPDEKLQWDRDLPENKSEMREELLQACSYLGLAHPRRGPLNQFMQTAEHVTNKDTG
eukprot:8462321-Lingulodinium_polyedra.AAC.1